MVTDIIQIADLHITNNVTEFQEKEKFFLKTLLKETKTMNHETMRIVIVGDIFEGKVKASNEAKAEFHKILNILDSICPVIIVAGNHDMLQGNKSKLDSIAPTFEIAGAYDNITYLDKKLEYKSGCVFDDNIIWALYSMHDNFARPDIESMKKKHPKAVVVGLYHGAVPGATTDVGFMHDSGLPGEAFEGCDCVMAGHIHKRQEIRKEGIPLVYSGSVFQKDFGENTTGHGFEVWNVETLEHKHVEVDNPFKMYKFRIEGYDDVKEDKEKLLNL